MTNWLVTGASGYLGAYLMAAASATPGTPRVSGTYFSEPPPVVPAPLHWLDLRDSEAVRQLLGQLKPQAVIHTACSNRDEANVSAIVPAARNLAAACHAADIRLVHISTDLVFDGEHAPYADEAAPAPIMPYGRAKAEAEAALAELCPEAVIVRPSLIWALDPPDRQTSWLLDGLRRGAPVTLFTDEIRCPIYLPDLAAALIELAARPEVAGPMNVGGAQALNRWEFGLRLLKAHGVARTENIQPGLIADSGLVRGRNLSLEGRRASALLARPLRGVDEVLADEARPRGGYA